MAGRKRSQLTGAGAATDLARRLRELRDESGLTLRQTAAKSGYSVGTLSAAEGGQRTPSWDVTEAFVQSCGGDPSQWRQLWELAAASGPSKAEAATDDTAETAPPSVEPIPEEQPTTEEDRPRRRLRLIGPMAGATVLAVLIWASAWVSHGPGKGAGTVKQGSANSVAASPTGGSPTPSTTVRFAKDGSDPYDDGCKADQEQLDWQPVYRADKSVFGTIELRYSKACGAAWGYLAGPNSKSWTIHILTHRNPDGAQLTWQFSGDVAAGSWGNVLSTAKGCVWVEAFVTDAHGDGPHARTACVQIPTAGSS